MAPIDVVVVGAAARDIHPDDARGWSLGGGVTFGALALARLGIRVGVLIGLDPEAWSAHELDLLATAGAQLVRVPLDHGPIFNNQERPSGRIQTCLSASDRVPTSALPVAWRDTAAWMLAPVAAEIGDDWAAIPPHGSCVTYAWQGDLRQLRAGERVVPLRPRPTDLLRRADLVAVSRHDIPHELTWHEIGSWLAPRAEMLLTAGPEGGLLLSFDGGRLHGARLYPSLPSRGEVDPTGAGDTMLSGLLAARIAAGSQGCAPGLDLRLGAAAASLLVERVGLDAVPWLHEVRARLVGEG